MRLSNQKTRRPRRFFSGYEMLETRQLLTGGALTIPLDPTLDQFGDQIMTVMGYGADGAKSSFGIFDTGASAMTFSADDQGLFQFLSDGVGIPIKNPGGAAASGIGGDIIGDVSEPGTIVADGMHASKLTFDKDGFPVFGMSFDGAASTSGIQAFVGTATGSPDMPTITGTPLLVKSPEHPAGLAAKVDMTGETLDFSDIAPGLVLPMPDVHFVDPSTTLPSVDGSTDPVKIPLVPYGTDNYADPGDVITESNNQLIPGVSVVDASATLSGQNFLLDTGAQLSVISTADAQALGLDLAHPETTITVRGVAGSQDVPGFTLKDLVLPRTDGGTIHLTNIPIYVLDVAPGIDGILGMNAFDTADKLLFNPYDPAGASLSVTYITNPNRNAPPDLGGQLGVLLGKSNKGILNSIHGHSLPGFIGASASIDVSPSVTSPVYGQAESFRITLPADAKGTVTLVDGSKTIGTAALDHGKATIVATALPAGSHKFTVNYSGDAKYRKSVSKPINLTVGQDSTGVGLVSLSPHAVVGQTVSFVAAIYPGAPGSGTPSGTVYLVEGNKIVGSAPLKNGFGTVSLPFGTAASHPLRAVYTGDANFKSSVSGLVTETVSPDPTATLLSYTSVNVKTGKKIVPSYQFTMQVSASAPGSGMPLGAFVLHVGAVNYLATSVNGRASVTIAASIVKGARIYATFMGEPRYLASNSAAITIGGKGVKGLSLAKKG